jgi:hypothetical protein
VGPELARCVHKESNQRFSSQVPAKESLANCNERRGITGPGKKINYLRQTTSGAAGSGLGTMAKYLRQPTSGAAGKGLGATAKYLRRTTSGAAG